MNFDTSNNLREARQRFVEGKSIYYACLVPGFDWFKKEFSISKIFEPVKTKITQQIIFNAHIDDKDRIDLSPKCISQVTRKYHLHLYFDNLEKTV